MDTRKSMTADQARRRAQDRAAKVLHFIRFAGVYLALGLFFLLINLFSGPGDLWFFWPMLPMTIPLVILAWRAFAEPKFDDQWVERQVERSVARTQSTTARTTAATEIDDIAERASRLIDEMRRSARQIPTPAVRTQALDVCAAADRVLSAIGDNPEEVVLARDFVSRYLTPANSILSDYSRLARRNVASAEPTLRRVEEHDLPLLEEKLNDVHDRLHRGSLIDLQVAREMLSLDVADWGVEEIVDRAELTEEAPAKKRGS
jgi:uncharacterized protein Yka (UPF0111/DUF47 family)